MRITSKVKQEFGELLLPKFKKIGPVWVVLILELMTLAAYYPLLMWGKVPVAFDWGVNNYQPWKVDFLNTSQPAPKLAGHDDVRIFYPQRKLIIESLKKGVIPYWNPYEFSGNVLMANSQTAIFYPLFWIFLLLPQIGAWTLMSFLVPVMAGLGMYLFLRRVVNHDLAAVVGALAWAYSEVIITRSPDGLVAGHTLIWLPWVVWGVEKLRRGENGGGLLVAVLAQSLSMTAGWFQFTCYTYLVGGMYGMYWWWREKDKSLVVKYGLASLMSLGITAAHWLPAYLALQWTPRGTMGTPVEFAREHLMPLWQVVTLAVPHFFGQVINGSYFGTSEYKEGVMTVGVLPLLLALVGLTSKNKLPVLKFGFWLMMFGLVMGTNNPIAVMVLKLNLPIVSTFLPNRWLVLVTVGLSILAAAGMEQILRNRWKVFGKWLEIIVAAFGGFYALVAGMYGYEKVLAGGLGWSFFEHGWERYVMVAVNNSWLPFILVVVLMLVMLGTKRRLWVVGTLVGLMALGQVSRAHQYWYFSDPAHAFPDNPIWTYLDDQTKDNRARVLGISYSRFTSDTPSYYGLYSPEGVDALYPIWYGEFTNFYDGLFPYKGETKRIEASFAEALERRGWTDPMTVNMLAHLGVEYVVVPKDHGDMPPEPDYSKVFAYQWHSVYRFNLALPKVYFVTSYVTSDWPDLTLERVFEPEFFGQLKSQVVLATDSEKIKEPWRSLGGQLKDNFDLKLQRYLEGNKFNDFDTLAQFEKNLINNPVEVNQYEGNRMELMVSARSNGFVVVGDTFFPGWQAEVDGTPAPVYRANGTFRAVPVKAGEHRIVMKFVPEGWQQGKMVSMITVAGGLMMVGGWILIKRLRANYGP